MPEGPEIKRAADKLAAVIQNEPALLVEFAFPHLQQQAMMLTGQTIHKVESRGKAMLIHFANEQTIYSHNQLYGAWAILGQDERPRPSLQVRIAIHTQRKIAVLYSASEIEVLPTARFTEHPYIAKLGVELLAEATTQMDVLTQINQPCFARKNLAAILLDQSFLAGIGNYLRSEILFFARIHPEARIAELAPARRLALAQAAIDITRLSYRTVGITNSLAIANRLKAAGKSFGQYRHWVFDREGGDCYRCQCQIARVNVSGRGLYWCSNCQLR